jgi:SDR family mycofactocin-dependent oxidoreductase
MPDRLRGRVAFVTGAGRGQGRAYAVRLASEGADVIVIDRCTDGDTTTYPMATRDDLDETVRLVEKQGRRALASVVDVRDYDGLSSALRAGVAELGRLDIVVANAGIAPVFGTTGLAADAWTDAIDVLLTGVYLTLDVAVPTIVAQDQGGSIVITSSTAGLKGIGRNLAATSPGMIGYTAAKHGVVGLMRLYANLLAPHRIRVNTLHPTGVNTPMVVNEQFNRFLEEFPNAGDAMQNALPVQLVEPEDIANAAAWLCSDEARYITGVTLPVDAGFTVR